MLFKIMKFGKKVTIKQTFFTNKKSLFFLAYLLVLPELTFAQLAAFPGAEGFGAVAIGGRGGDVYRVTKLTDDGSPGTLRDAIESANGPRTIVFTVGGNIKLESKLKILSDGLTIAGQTAPGGGITLYGYPLDITNRSSIIIRYLRVRPGDFNAKGIPGKPGRGNQDLKGAGGDGISLHGTTNTILDHVSISWSMDEALDISGGSKNVTVQHSIISEGLFNSFHHKGRHSRATLFRGMNSPDEMSDKSGGFSLVGNILAHCNMRMPLVGGEAHPSDDTSIDQIRGLNIDVENNIIYNWGQRNGHTATNAAVNMNYVNNYLIAGPSTVDTDPPGEHSNLNTAMRIEEDEDDLDRFFMYQSGNHMDTDKDSLHNGALVGDEVFIGFETFERLSTRHAFPEVTTLSAEDAYNVVLAKAGASISRDDIDTRLIDNVMTRSGKLIDSQEDVGGIVPIANGTAPADSDQDGMPDTWETTHGLNPDNSDDGRDFTISNEGYTNLEVYLNELASTPSDGLLD